MPSFQDSSEAISDEIPLVLFHKQNIRPSQLPSSLDPAVVYIPAVGVGLTILQKDLNDFDGRTWCSDVTGHAYMDKYHNYCYLAVTVVFNIFDCSCELFIIIG